MTPAPTAIRLIETADAAPLAAHLADDAEQLSRWSPHAPRASPRPHTRPSHRHGSATLRDGECSSVSISNG